MAKFEDIKQYLQSQNIDFQTINLPTAAVSVDDVIRLTNGQIKGDEIIKTLIVKLNTGQFVACILRGRDKLNLNHGFERLASKEEVIGIAGVEVGAVCPILVGVPIIIDQNVTQLKRVNMGSGDHLIGLEMDFEDLLKVLSDYRTEEISV